MTTTRARQADVSADIERLRLRVAELEQGDAALRRRLEEGLAREQALAEVLRAIGEAPGDAQAVLDAIAQRAVRLCGAEDGAVRLIEGADLVTVSNAGGPRWNPPVGTRLPIRSGSGSPAIAIGERRTHVIHDTREYETTRHLFGERGVASILNVPLLRRGEAIGVVTVNHGEPYAFTSERVALLEAFAAQAVIAIENARLFQALQESNATLTEALEQQTATVGVLDVISRSAFDVRPVFDTVLRSAIRLCGADGGHLWRLYGGGGGRDGADLHFRLEVAHGGSDAYRAMLGRSRVATGPGTLNGAVWHQRRPVQIADALTDASYQWREAQQMGGFRTLLGVPLLLDGEPIGVLVVWRSEVRTFTPRQIDLLTTFATQAVIAIENSRLFSELQERDERRRQELERASAIQQRLLPQTVCGWPGALEVAVRFRPAVETSGDFYDVLRLAPTAEDGLPPLQIAVGDVAGKGMSAALVTALARSALHATASVPTRMAVPSATLREAGSRLHRDVGAQHFVACALAVVEPPGRHSAGPLLRLANAAQVPVLLVRDGHAEELEPPGYRLPLGAQDDGDYEDVRVELRPGDVVVFSSDGLVEAPALASAAAPDHLPSPTQAGELFGFERLQRSAAHWTLRADSAEAIAEGMWADLTAWCGSELNHDDVTLLVLRVPAP